MEGHGEGGARAILDVMLIKAIPISLSTQLSGK
jgi:hypothetical protein